MQQRLPLAATWLCTWAAPLCLWGGSAALKDLLCGVEAWRCDSCPLICSNLWRSEDRLGPYCQWRGLSTLKESEQTHGVSPDFRCFPVNKEPTTSETGRGRYTVNKSVPGLLFGDFKVVLIIQRLNDCGSESILTNAHCASHLKCYNTLNEIWSPSAAALPKFVNRCLEMIQLPQRNAMLLKFYFLAHLGMGAGSCMTELQINFTVFTVAFFLLSQGLWFGGDWALRSSLSALHTSHGQRIQSAKWFFPF